MKKKLACNFMQKQPFKLKYNCWGNVPKDLEKELILSSS